MARRAEILLVSPGPVLDDIESSWPYQREQRFKAGFCQFVEVRGIVYDQVERTNELVGHDPTQRCCVGLICSPVDLEPVFEALSVAALPVPSPLPGSAAGV